jgi:hypothetical protein
MVSIEANLNDAIEKMQDLVDAIEKPVSLKI